MINFMCWLSYSKKYKKAGLSVGGTFSPVEKKSKIYLDVKSVKK